MKKGLIMLFAGVCFVAASQTAPPKVITEKNVPEKKELRKITNRAFKTGEVIEYRVHYGFIDAGIARLEVKPELKNIGGREIFHVVGTGQSQGTFDFFFKVRDRYETYLDAEGIFPWLFVRHVDEGGFKFSQQYKFFQNRNQVDNGKGKVFDTPDNVQDMVSAFYYARTIDMSKMKKGDTITVHSFVDNEIFPLRIRFAGVETVKVDKGKFSCLKFHPVVQKGRVFKKEDDLTVWITNDGNKIPVLAQAKILVGSIKMELQDYSGLANPVSLVK